MDLNKRVQCSEAHGIGKVILLLSTLSQMFVHVIRVLIYQITCNVLNIVLSSFSTITKADGNCALVLFNTVRLT